MALILIVEDEPALLVLAESIIQSAGHQTLSAGSYDGAVALFEQGERPELVFVDRNLGEGLTGIDVSRKARQYNTDILVLYTTGDVVRRCSSMVLHFCRSPIRMSNSSTPSTSCLQKAPRFNTAAHFNDW